jgi:spore coat polysaccharide biosynthesis protein SpsF
VDVLKRLIIGGKKVNAKIIVRASSENPFLYGKGIDKLIKKHISGDYDLSYLGGLPLGVGMQVVNLEALEKSHKEGSKRHRSEFCTMYINENPTKFKTYRLNPSKSLNRPELRLTVDTPQDLIVVRTIIEKISKNNSTTPLDKIIKFLDNNPKIKKLNSNILIKYKREDL